MTRKAAIGKTRDMTGSRASRSLHTLAGISLGFLLLFAGCASRDRTHVLEIERTWSYHTPQCTRVFMARTTEITREQARALHLHPCPYCKPDSQR